MSQFLRVILALAAILVPTASFATHLGSVQYEAGAIAANPITNRVYGVSSGGVRVYNEQDGSIQVLGTDLSSVQVDPVNNRIYGAVSGQSSVALIDGTTHAVTPIALAAAPGGMQINPVTNKLYVITTSTNQVAVVDLATLAVNTVTVGAAPGAVVVNAVTNKIYVVGGTTLTVIDGVTLATTPLSLPGTARALGVNMTTNKIFVLHDVTATPAAPALTKVDGVTLATTSVTVAVNENSLAVNSLTDRVYVGSSTGNTFNGVVAIVNGTTLAKTDVGGTIYVCCNIVVNMTGHEAYAAGAGGTCNLCPNTSTLKIDGDSDVASSGGIGANSMTVNPVTNRKYSTTHFQGSAGFHTDNLNAVAGVAARPNGLTTAISTIPGNSTGSLNPNFTFTPSSTSTLPVQRVYYRVDSVEGTWIPAVQSGGTWSGRTGQLAPGAHVLYAFSVDARSTVPSAPMTGEMATYSFTVTNACQSVSCADLAILQEAIPPQQGTQKDIVMNITTSNGGGADATGVVLTNMLPAGAQFIWAAPPCANAGGVVTCPIGTIAAGANKVLYTAFRMAAAGPVTSNASVTSAVFDPQAGDNGSAVGITVTTSTPGVPIFRYRLYSDVTKEHHFTTDLNEYNVLGTYIGTWVQEGTVGKVLNNPGSFGGVQAVPYYRLYDTSTHWHHWTTDPNEYYTLALVPSWNAEGVDGYLLPTQALGTIQLYRLNYPPLGSLHHWTIDQNEYTTLINVYGWVGEGGSGFVVQ